MNYRLGTNKSYCLKSFRCTVERFLKVSIGQRSKQEFENLPKSVKLPDSFIQMRNYDIPKSQEKPRPSSVYN
jgi:hypothetical protein